MQQIKKLGIPAAAAVAGAELADRVAGQTGPLAWVVKIAGAGVGLYLAARFAK